MSSDIRRAPAASLDPRATTVVRSRSVREIIIVAPEEVLSAIQRRVTGGAVRAFTTLEALDRWRTTRRELRDGIAGDVTRALAETGCGATQLQPRLRSLLEFVAEKNHAPTLHELEQQWNSRRSFFRVWKAAIHCTPSAFLRKVRALHAQRLLASGIPRKEAALLAGYQSVDAMRRNLA